MGESWRTSVEGSKGICHLGVDEAVENFPLRYTTFSSQFVSSFGFGAGYIDWKYIVFLLSAFNSPDNGCNLAQDNAFENISPYSAVVGMLFCKYRRRIILSPVQGNNTDPRQ